LRDKPGGNSGPFLCCNLNLTIKRQSQIVCLSGAVAPDTLPGDSGCLIQTLQYENQDRHRLSIGRLRRFARKQARHRRRRRRRIQGRKSRG